MSRRHLEAFVLPSTVPPPNGAVRANEAEDVEIRLPDATDGWVEELGGALRAAGGGLRARSAEEIAVTLGRVGARFLDAADPIRVEALGLLPGTSGLSPDMCAAVLDGMAGDWSARALTRLVRVELGDAAVLDRFTRVSGREAMAFGPALCVQIVAGSVPGVGVNALLRSLLVKGPTLLKPGRGDVVLPVLFARAVKEIDPALADAMAVVYWAGGEPHLERAAVAEADVVTAYGSDATVRELRAMVGVTTRFVPYHHRVSVGLVGREALCLATLDETADQVAASVGLFDQRGCVSPQVVFVEEGGECSPRDFTSSLARALAELEERLPGGRLTASEASGLHQTRGSAELMGPTSGAEVIHGGDATWTVIYEPGPGPTVACVGRVIRVRPLPDARDLPRLLTPLSTHLQTVGVAGLGARLEPTARALGAVGASRVAPFSAVPFPPQWWQHDGGGPLRDLVRWVGLERG